MEYHCQRLNAITAAASTGTCQQSLTFFYQNYTTTWHNPRSYNVWWIHLIKEIVLIVRLFVLLFHNRSFLGSHLECTTQETKTFIAKEWGHQQHCNNWTLSSYSDSVLLGKVRLKIQINYPIFQHKAMWKMAVQIPLPVHSRHAIHWECAEKYDKVLSHHYRLKHSYVCKTGRCVRDNVCL